MHVPSFVFIVRGTALFATVPFVSMVKVLEHQPEAILQVLVWLWAMNESIILYFF